MFQNFNLFFQLGVEHILDINGYDHLLFLLALSALYLDFHFKKLVILVTAFTLGHSATLILAATEVVKVNSDLIEFLIPITIALTALLNLILFRHRHNRSFLYTHYSLACVFGLIHGLGFSSYFRMLIGDELNLVSALFAFNIGIEIAQVIILVGVLLLYLIMRKLKVSNFQNISSFISGIAFGIALIIIQNAEFLK